MGDEKLYVEIRQELAHDFPAVYNIHYDAFGRKEEPRLADRLRLSQAFIPELSLVAIVDEKIVGHIMFTQIEIIGQDKKAIGLALAPMAVIPHMQRKGVGSLLVKHGLKKAKTLGYDSVFVLGHKHYYPRFGFTSTNKWQIKAPFNVPEDVFMGLELAENGLSNIRGVVKFTEEFGEI